MEFETIRGTPVPAVGLGTWRMDERTARTSVETALDLGYRHVDTAQLYENEAGVGRGIQAADVPREDLFVTTKVNPWHRHFDAMVASVEESLEALDLETVDLLLIHWPNPLSDLETVMAALDEARDRGYTRHIGVSNFGRDRLDRARDLADSPVVTDQVQFHPFWPQRELLEYCQREDVLLTAYSPLAHGGALTDSLVADIAAAHDRTPAQVVLRWVIQHENVITIPKSTSPAHLEENLGVLDFELTPEEHRRLTRPSWLKTGWYFLRGRFGV
jgi:diketogulonate reductase-like aldo/keto reductase